MSLLIDSREGSYLLANHEPIRSLLSICPDCKATKIGCKSCRGTGRELTRLSEGNESSTDVAFVGSGPGDKSIMVGIEVKTIDDLITSLKINRLQSQMFRMLEDGYGVRYLVYYGDFIPSRPDIDGRVYIKIWRRATKNRKAGYYTLSIGGKPILYAYLMSFLTGPAPKRLGFTVVRCRDIDEASLMIGIIYHSWTRKYSSHKSLKVLNQAGSIDGKVRKEMIKREAEGNGNNGESDIFPSVSLDFSSSSLPPTVRNKDPKWQQRVAFANSFPFMGYERSVAAADHFRSVTDMVRAGVDEWSGVIVTSDSGRKARLGRSIAKNIVERMR